MSTTHAGCSARISRNIVMAAWADARCVHAVQDRLAWSRTARTKHTCSHLKRAQGGSCKPCEGGSGLCASCRAVLIAATSSPHGQQLRGLGLQKLPTGHASAATAADRSARAIRGSTLENSTATLPMNARSLSVRCHTL